MIRHSLTEDLRAAVSELEPIDQLYALLNAASIIADNESQDELHAEDPFTFLAQLIDTALARTETLQEQLADV